MHSKVFTNAPKVATNVNSKFSKTGYFQIIKCTYDRHAFNMYYITGRMNERSTDNWILKNYQFRTIDKNCISEKK